MFVCIYIECVFPWPFPERHGRYFLDVFSHALLVYDVDIDDEKEKEREKKKRYVSANSTRSRRRCRYIGALKKYLGRINDER